MGWFVLLNIEYVCMIYFILDNRRDVRREDHIKEFC